jgi:hypothetical protein
VTDNSRDASQEAKGIDRCCMVLLFSPPLVQIDQTLLFSNLHLFLSMEEAVEHLTKALLTNHVWY